jgi:formate hydrogenlyase subunit 6/NADH:ubiquinone oxidoreductase subunit I
MGIDVRAYAMANKHVKRAAGVGCRMCAHVCPRSVLKLENSPERFKGGTASASTRSTCRTAMAK